MSIVEQLVSRESGGFTKAPDIVEYSRSGVPVALPRAFHAAALLSTRNQVLLVAKHYPPRLLIQFAWPILFSQSLWGVVTFRHGAFLAFLRGKFEGLGGFRAARRSAATLDIDPDRLDQILRDSEREIRWVQLRTGFDRFWRVYFALTPGGAV